MSLMVKETFTGTLVAFFVCTVNAGVGLWENDVKRIIVFLGLYALCFVYYMAGWKRGFNYEH